MQGSWVSWGPCITWHGPRALHRALPRACMCVCRWGDGSQPMLGVVCVAALHAPRPPSMPTGPVHRPAGSRVELENTAGKLDIDIPPQGLGGSNIGTGLFALAWNAFVAFWTVRAELGAGRAAAAHCQAAHVPSKQCGAESGVEQCAVCSIESLHSSSAAMRTVLEGLLCRFVTTALLYCAYVPVCSSLPLPVAASCLPCSVRPSGLPATS